MTDEINSIEVRQRLKSLRKASKLIQTEVDKYLSLDKGMMSKIENGYTNITSDIIEKLSNLFCVTIDYILFGVKHYQPHTTSFDLSSLSSDELKAIAIINKIALNQFEMDCLMEEC